jgi:hypothetical protein
VGGPGLGGRRGVTVRVRVRVRVCPTRDSPSHWQAALRLLPAAALAVTDTLAAAAQQAGSLAPRPPAQGYSPRLRPPAGGYLRETEKTEGHTLSLGH